MSSRTVSDFVIDRLIEWDLHRFYGFPGDGIGGFDGALERAESDGKAFRYIRPTHEEIAAFMACAHAKFTGEVGVCMSTSDPGAVHMMNGLYDAKCDNQPVVAVVGQQARVAMGSDFQQELNMKRLFGDVAEYVKRVLTPMQAQLVVDRAAHSQESGIDCWICPAAGSVAPPHGDDGDSWITCFWSLAGWPAVSVPIFDGERGLPHGLQVIAPHGRDEQLLQWAVDIQTGLGSDVG
ncbi:MAG: thiamine pyrophosphate-binding protein [Jatrophihabitans sp.]